MIYTDDSCYGYIISDIKSGKLYASKMQGHMSLKSPDLNCVIPEPFLFVTVLCQGGGIVNRYGQVILQAINQDFKNGVSINTGFDFEKTMTNMIEEWKSGDRWKV